MHLGSERIRFGGMPPLPPSLSGLFSAREGTLSVFTFRLEGMSYAVLTSKVHSVVQDEGKIRKLPFLAQGLMGIANHGGRPVAIFDFAHRLGCRSGREHKEEILLSLQEQEREHLHWVASLEASLCDGRVFDRERDPTRCAYGRWLSVFDSHDEALLEILNRTHRPHQRIHQLATKLLEQAQSGDRVGAMEELEIVGRPVLTRFLGLCHEAMSHLRVTSRSVILYLTEDGLTPVLGLRIDEVEDMVRFRPEQVFPPEQVGVPLKEELRPLVLGYLSNGKDSDCILIDPVRDLEGTVTRLEELKLVRNA